MSDRGTVTISLETAEYLACLAGQVVWGNRQRRRKAAAELGQAMESQRMTSSSMCFQVKEGEELLQCPQCRGKAKK